MQFSYYRPRDPLLSDLIEGYYFLRGTRPDSSLSYYTFPNNYSILSMLVNSDLSVEGNRVICSGVSGASRACGTPGTSVASGASRDFGASATSGAFGTSGASGAFRDLGARFQCNLTINYTEPLLIQYTGEVNELTIYFKPLGLHAFLSFSAGYHKVDRFFEFRPFDDLESVMRWVLLSGDRERQISALEDYLISKATLAIDPVLIDLRDSVEGEMDIWAIADHFGYSRQYLSRLFSYHFGKSPSIYRKIHRFRNVVKTRPGSTTMTELGLENLFYDQSHFIREFKELTLLSPKKFFDKVDTGEGNLWLYV